VAPHQKKASRHKAWLIFLDESGFLMAPLVRRSWARRGHAPVLYQRTRLHQKVSAIAALCVPPARNQVHLCFRLHPDANIAARLVIDFLRVLRTHIAGPIVLIWDRLLAHRAKRTQRFLAQCPDLHSHFLPSYAPELNPVENVWSYTKMNPMANLAILNLDCLTRTARRHGRSLQRKPHLLRSFIAHSRLSLRLT
jgi:transposase